MTSAYVIDFGETRWRDKQGARYGARSIEHGARGMVKIVDCGLRNEEA